MKPGLAADAAAPRPRHRALIAMAIFLLASMLFFGFLTQPADRPLDPGDRENLVKFDVILRTLIHPSLAMGDSWGPMTDAHEWLKGQHSTTLYQEIFFDRRIKFQYPPTALLPLALLEAVHLPPSLGVLNHINQVALFLCVVATGVLGLSLASRAGALQAKGPVARALVVATVAVASLFFYPVLWSYTTGQIQVWIDACFVLACLALLHGRRPAAGMLIGLVCMLKPPFGLYLLWGLLRRQWRFLLGWIATVVPLGLASLFLYGLRNHLDYLAALSYMSRRGESFFPNQSVNGLLNRLLQNGDNLTFELHDFAPYQPVVYGATLLTSILLIAGALFLRGRQADRGGLHDFMTAALTFTIASPIAWTHHYGILPPILVSLAAALLAAPDRRGSVALWLTLAAAYVLSANYFAAANLVAATPFNFVQSYVLLAGLLTLWLLYRVPTPASFARRPGAPAEPGMPVAAGPSW